MAATLERSSDEINRSLARHLQRIAGLDGVTISEEAALIMAINIRKQLQEGRLLVSQRRIDQLKRLK